MPLWFLQYKTKKKENGNENESMGERIGYIIEF